MISYSQYVSYFQNLAAKCTLIAHTTEAPRFAVEDIDNIIGAGRTSLDMRFPCMILENPEGSLAWRNDAVLDSNMGAFYIVKNVAREKPVEKAATIDEMKAIWWQVILRMQYEKQQRSKGNKTFPHHALFFDLDRVKYFKVGPVFNHAFGWRVEFDLQDTSAPTFDMANWSDLTP